MTIEEYLAFRRLLDSEKESEGATLAAREDSTRDKPKKPRSSAYSRRYKAAFRKVAPSYKLKSGKWKQGGFRRAVREAHRRAKK